MSARQDSDNLAWDRSDELWDEAVKQVRLSPYCRKIESFAEGILGVPAKLKTPLIIGGFNVLYPIQIQGSSCGFLVCQPLPNQAVFPKEKTLAKAATAIYITQHTQLLVPKVFYYSVDPSCDDLRPANVLVNDNNSVLGVIDWEFAYAALTQFILDSPWWLLLDKPEAWDGSIEEWTSIYEVRLQAWLRALEEAERELEPGSFLLSAYMRESWETGRFWLDYAAMRSWAFDTVYWTYLDERFFGERGEAGVRAGELWKTRVHLLSEEERAAMEPLVQIKMDESKERVLVDWDDEEATRRLSSFLFD
ncbi:hypothetical protein CTA2_12687 [Colletotrichum tanaceti]|uniref:Aminoglycoside phosphotransferase domain-containing protein n=1 Tax=Colletotrichum tanaceti TaxID=1306861 RepID=A0A4U6XBM2_9PEZI|nr:hypothetical protein CTA2_12687 [Colletotrichum tanaceti]TKW52774.1 hypothetical protein CTA1_7307 [Colletotrichum tanaceti]